MTSFNLTLNSSLGDDDLEAELGPDDKKDELADPGESEEGTGKSLKKPARKDSSEEDILESADDSEPEIDNSYLKDFGDGKAE